MILLEWYGDDHDRRYGHVQSQRFDTMTEARQHADAIIGRGGTLIRFAEDPAPPVTPAAPYAARQEAELHAGETVVPLAQEVAEEEPEIEEPGRPYINDPKADWVHYAEAHGVEDADQFTKSELIDLFKE